MERRSLAERVASVRQCLTALGERQRRVLRLRAGLGDGPPLTREQVARRLDVDAERVVRLERAGLRRLATVVRDGCGGTAASVEVAEDLLSRAGVVAGGADGSGGTAVGQGAVKGERASSREGGGDRDDDGGFPFLPAGDQEIVLPLLLLAMALGVLALVARHELRRR